MEFEKNVWLKNYTTFKIGGKAKYFFKAKTKEELIEAVKIAEQEKLPFFILGGGSNLLVSDKGFNGLVIKIETRDYKLETDKIYAQAGMELAQIVDFVAKKSLKGLEWTKGIPGTIGGAIYGNAAAFGNSIGNFIEEVECLEIEPFLRVQPPKIRIFKNKGCEFNFKDSIFKKNKNLIILACIIQLKKGDKKEIKKKMKYFLNYRKKSQPLKFPSAGCIFKNFTQASFRNEASPVSLREAEQVGTKPLRISTAELIDKSGLKGRKIGRAMISKKHANFIINLGGAEAKDVLKLINLIKKEVKEKFRIELEEEISKVGVDISSYNLE